MTPAGAVVGVGIDAVELERFRAALSRRPGLRQRVFTDAEQDAVSPRVDAAPGLAARFAVKEAVMKSLGVGLGAVALRDIEVTGGAGGRPGVALHGPAAVHAHRLGVAAVHVSMTHTASTAHAVAVATAGTPA